MTIFQQPKSYQRRIAATAKIHSRSNRAVLYDRHKRKKVSADKIVKIILGVFILLVATAIYFLFFFPGWRITVVNLPATLPTVDEQGAKEKITLEINNYLSDDRLLILSNSAYFFFREDELLNRLQTAGLYGNFKVTKDFPKTINLALEQNPINFLWHAQDKYYLINNGGIAQASQNNFINMGYGVIEDTASTTELALSTTKPAIDPALAILILEINNYFTNEAFGGPNKAIIKIDGPTATYVNILLESGTVIQVNFIENFQNQISKLEQAITAGKIDLKKAQIINLRIKDQVIVQ
jgi:hypothetical protein